MGVGAKRALGLYRSCAPRHRRLGFRPLGCGWRATGPPGVRTAGSNRLGWLSRMSLFASSSPCSARSVKRPRLSNVDREFWVLLRVASAIRLDEHLELLRCYYNFVRPHGALKFGREIRTPAMQAGLTTRRLTFGDIFLATTIPLWSRIEVFVLSRARNPVSSAPVPLPAAA